MDAEHEAGYDAAATLLADRPIATMAEPLAELLASLSHPDGRRGAGAAIGDAAMEELEAVQALLGIAVARAKAAETRLGEIKD